MLFRSRALRGCLQSYTTNHRIDKTSLIDTHDHFVFHMNSRYHAHMAFQTVCNFCWDRDDVTKEEIQKLFDAKVLASTEVCRRTGSNYTSSVYCGLLSLAALAGDAGLENKRMLVYSYGSGCAASIYALDTKGSPIVGPVFGRLDDRERVSPQEIDRVLSLYKKSHMRFGFTPEHQVKKLDGAYYLAEVDAKGRRWYEQHSDAVQCGIRVEDKCGLSDESSGVGCVRVVLLTETLTLNEATMAAWERALGHGKPIWISSESENFGLGADLSKGGFDSEAEGAAAQGLTAYQTLLERLMEYAHPIIVTCHGHTRGGSMAFPCVADLVIATEEATFGFPEIRRGALPGLVSVVAQRRIGAHECRRLMLLGDAFGVEHGQKIGLVDQMYDAVNKSEEEKVKTWLAMWNERVSMSESAPISREVLRASDAAPAVSLRWQNADEQTAMITSRGRSFCDDIVTDLSSLCMKLAQCSSLRGVVLIICNPSQQQQEEPVSEAAVDQAIRSLHSLHVPIVAVLDGQIRSYALLAFVSHMDMRVASRSVTVETLTDPEIGRAHV